MNSVNMLAAPCFTGFEGAEKKLLIRFSTASLGEEDRGLRQLSRADWSKVLDLAHCTILSHAENPHFDAYVLSESSLFVYRNQVILKTCGTSSLLLCLPLVLEMAEGLSLAVEFVFYSRRNFMFPEKQPAPHTGFSAEVVYLKRYFANGQDSTFGPHEGDHWNVFVADYRAEGKVLLPEHRFTYEITLTCLDETAMKQFYKVEYGDTTAKEMLASSGIGSLVKGAQTDAFLFEPCGFSMNALLETGYYSMHITPEPQCSFVSFETNATCTEVSLLTELILDLFKPGKFIVSQVRDDHVSEEDITSKVPEFPLALNSAYKEVNRAGHNFGGSCDVLAWSFGREEDVDLLGAC